MFPFEHQTKQLNAKYLYLYGLGQLGDRSDEISEDPTILRHVDQLGQ